MKKRYLATTIFTRPIRIRAFNSMAPIPYGSGYVDNAAVRTMIAMAQNAAGQHEHVNDDLGKRDEASAWMLDYWDLADDLTEGYKALKAQGAKYLPKFHDETQPEYADRLQLTEYTNVFADIVETLASKPFEEECTVVKPRGEDKVTERDLPPEIEAFAEDVDGAGNNLTSFAASTFFNGINSAIDWIYVDYPTVDTSIVRSVAQAKAENIRPFWSHVLGRNVLEAKSEMIGAKEVLTYMRILEPGTPNHIRIFARDPGGIVHMGLFQEKIAQDGKTKQYILIKATVITIGAIPLVKFATGRRDGRTFKFLPPMRGAADLQVEVYQKESGLKFARTMTAYPMLAANGIVPEKGADGKPIKLRVGPSRVLYAIPGGDGKVGSWAYVSPDAACLTFLKNDIKETQDALRELGRQPLTAQSNNLTVITTAYAAGKAKTAVGAWAYVLKDALENAMRLTCQWMGINDATYEPEIFVFTDFDDFATDQGADLEALNKTRDRKDISRRQLTHEFRRRGTLRAEFSDEVNEKELLEEVPSDIELAEDGADPPDGKPIPKKPAPPKKVAKP